MSKQIRESTKTHNMMIEDYYELDEYEQYKDTEPMNCMLKIIRKYAGVGVYKR